jgi:hypothetical protein
MSEKVGLGGFQRHEVSRTTLCQRGSGTHKIQGNITNSKRKYSKISARIANIRSVVK